jgi:hypothetical protein
LDLGADFSCAVVTHASDATMIMSSGTLKMVNVWVRDMSTFPLSRFNSAIKMRQNLTQHQQVRRSKSRPYRLLC